MNAPTPPGTVYNLLILDESGSMDVVRQTTVSGFNELVQTVQGLAREFSEKKQVVTLTTFNGLGINEKLFMQEASALQQLTLADYKPASMTPLHDAIGQSVSKLRNILTATGATSAQVLVTVLTDGEENASKEYSQAAVRKLVEELKAENWTFTYIGANHNVDHAADGLAIDNKLAFTQNVEEMGIMFQKERNARRRYNLKAMEAPFGDRQKADYFDDDEPALPPVSSDEPKS